MMHHLREFGQGFVAKILLGFLVLVFGFWGIGDIFRSGGGGHPVATVGSSNISLLEFQQQLHRRTEELRQMLGASYSPALLKQLHVENQVLSSLINSRLVEQEAAAEGIVIDDATVADLIRHNPSFAGADGKFDKAIYQSKLRSESGTEQRYVEDLRNDMEVGLLSDVWGVGGVVPESLVEALYGARAQQRIVTVSVFSPASIKDVPAPSEQDLKLYYDEHAKQFSVPEYRALRIVTLNPADIGAKIDISDSDIAHEYEERKQEFYEPERREVEQLSFEKEADAKLAADKYAKGARFKDIAASMHPINKDKITLGKITKQELPAEVADAVFELKENGITTPIQTEFGWNLLHVTHIEPEGQQSLAKAHDLLLKDMRGKQAQDTVYRLMTQLQDSLAGGEAIDVAAQKVGAKLEIFPPLSHSGNDEQGKQYTLPSQTSVLNAAFAINEKDNSSPVQAEDGSVIIVHVDQIVAEHTKSLDAVKDEVAKGWTEEKRRVLLHNRMGVVADHIHAGKTLVQAAEQEHIFPAITASGVKLSHDTQKFVEGPLAKTPLSPMLINEVFRLSTQQSTGAVALPDGSFCIAKLEQVIPAPDFHKNPDEKILTALRGELTTSLAKDELSSYLNYLRTKFKVTVNEDMLERIQASEESAE